MGKSIGVISLKGGVGKTSSVVALGSALADFGKKVLLVDANFSAPNLGMHLNILNPDKTIHDVMGRTVNILDAVQTVGNLDVLPASLFSKKNISPLKLKDNLSYLKRKYDYMIIDSSPALNDETLGAILASDKILVVTTPDVPTLGMTVKAIKVAKQRKTPIIGMILNKVHSKNFEMGLDVIEEMAEVPIMAIIPHDINFLKSLSEFVPYTSYKKRSAGAEEYKRLAGTLIGEKYKPIKMRSFLKWVNPQRQDINREVYYSQVFK